MPAGGFGSEYEVVIRKRLQIASAHTQHIEMEAIRRKESRKMRPGVVRAIRYRGVQIDRDSLEKQSIGGGWRKASRSPTALSIATPRGHVLLVQQRDEARAARMRPHVRMQQSA